MTLIREFSIPHNPEGIVRLPHSRSNSNRTSVLLGINGTSKSTLLRGLLDEALPDSVAKKSSRIPGVQVKLERRPSMVVAVSAVPNDRFPTKGRFGGGTYSHRYSADEYEYIGPRQGQNIVSRIQSLEALVSSALRDELIGSKARNFIKSLSIKTGIPCSFSVRLLKKFGAGAKSKSFINEFLSQKDYPGNRNPGVRALLEGLNAHDIAELDRLANFFSKSGRLHFDLSGQSDLCGFHPRHIRIALRSRFLSIGDISFGDVQARPQRSAAVDRYSAGQWGLFSSLATLALLSRDNMLVLVDEPESALHPSWQREYLDDLLAALSESKGCHVFLATHSPLIVGSMGSKNHDLILLRRDELTQMVEGTIAPVPSGWQSNNVLEDIFDLPSTRAPSLVRRLDAALKLVARGTAENKKALKNVVADLEPMMDSLPKEDSVRQVVRTLKKLSEEG